MSGGKFFQFALAIVFISAIVIKFKSNRSVEKSHIVNVTAKPARLKKAQAEQSMESEKMVSPVPQGQINSSVAAEPNKELLPFEPEYENHLNEIAKMIWPKGRRIMEGDMDGSYQHYKEMTADGKKILFDYKEGALYSQTLMSPDGEMQSRGFYPNGNLRRLNWKLPSEAKTDISYDEDGTMITREDELSNGDKIITHFENGKPISKEKVNKNGEKIDL